MIKDAVKLGTFIFATTLTYKVLDSFVTVTLKHVLDKNDSKSDERVEENEDES